MPVGVAIGATAGATVGAATLDRKSQKEAVKSQENQRNASQAFIEKMMEQTRGDLFKLYPSIQDTQQKGLQAGLDIYKQSFPVQMNAFRQGNVGAQQQLINAQPQIQNAILGKPINYSPQEQTIDAGIGGLRMPQAPQFQQIGGLGLQGNAQPQVSPEVLKALQAMMAGGANGYQV